EEELPPEEDEWGLQAEEQAEEPFDDAPGEGERGGPTSPGVENPFDEEDERTSVSAKIPDTMKQDAAELLNDVPLHVAVELARVPVTAEQVVGLHVGKILELGTAPGDPVNLSVNGRVVARGELVEVEGQLGVRILTLAD
ncbi:MAG: FliM/FliN family flagellar motor switch protein, partial [Myxococcales bacterium]